MKKVIQIMILALLMGGNIKAVSAGTCYMNCFDVEYTCTTTGKGNVCHEGDTCTDIQTGKSYICYQLQTSQECTGCGANDYSPAISR